MAVVAPLRVPVEIRRPGARFFRIADAISERDIHFLAPLPDALDGPLDMTFHLPEDPVPLSLSGRAAAEPGGDSAGGSPARRLVHFHQPDEESRARIARYVADRVPVE